ncbi:helix-turn-helix domain-containing protein [Winogradskyella sp.]|uniref:helix-turn-helix domain-containing protein n=1 Tax=Winogradskyella sp. TaxID=1883156 RepID=UPI003BACBC78
MTRLLANTVFNLLQIVFNLPLKIADDISSYFIRDLLVYIGCVSALCNAAVLYYAYHTIIINDRYGVVNKGSRPSNTQGLKQFVYLGFLVCLVWLIALVAIVVLDLYEPLVVYPIWTGLLILASWMAYVGLQQSKRFKKHIKTVRDCLRYNPSTPILEEKAKSFETLNAAIRTERLFLNPTIKLKDLANTHNLSEGYISQLINKHSGLNFNEFINTLRIDEAKHLLLNKDYDHYTIMAIGLESGFNSRASFYTAFKKYTGQTPSEFRKSVRNP